MTSSSLSTSVAYTTLRCSCDVSSGGEGGSEPFEGKDGGSSTLVVKRYHNVRTSHRLVPVGK